MNKAFTREDDDRPADPLPGPVISPHPNLVTAEGLAHIDTMVDQLTAEQAVAKVADDAAAVARTTRDLLYWQARRASAQLTEPPFSSLVQFGSRVTISRGKAAFKTYRLVGTDEVIGERHPLLCLAACAGADGKGGRRLRRDGWHDCRPRRCKLSSICLTLRL